MPDTWGDMNLAYGFGTDPFDPHANILAGTAFLKVLYDRFYPALFAAYNAGVRLVMRPFCARGKPLPDETKTYAANIEERFRKHLSLRRKATIRPCKLPLGQGCFSDFQLLKTARTEMKTPSLQTVFSCGFRPEQRRENDPFRAFFLSLFGSLFISFSALRRGFAAVGFLPPYV